MSDIDKPDPQPRSQMAWDLTVTLHDIASIRTAFEKAEMEIPKEMDQQMSHAENIFTFFGRLRT